MKTEVSFVAMSPTPPKFRAVEIDILRGFALFGVLLVNFQSPTMGGFIESGGNKLDAFGHWIIETFFNGRFYPLFSLLFGLGVSMQMARAKHERRVFERLYIRRLLVLFLVGLLHGLLLWEGDVLQIYALAGLLLLPAYGLGKRFFLALGGVFLIASMVVLPIAGTAMRRAVSTTPPQPAMTGDRHLTNKSYLGKSYRELVWARCVNHFGTCCWITRGVGFKLNITGMFLLGLFVGCFRVWEDFAAHRRMMRSVLWTALGFACVTIVWTPFCQGVASALRNDMPSISYAIDRLGGHTMSSIARKVRGPLFSIVYATGFLLLLQKAGWLVRFQPLAAIGRMSLSNYLLISLLGTTVFYGYGLGFYGRLGNAIGILLVLAFYLVQLILSNWWLKRFQYGPAEWLWRSLTYAKFQPLRLNSI